MAGPNKASRLQPAAPVPGTIAPFLSPGPTSKLSWCQWLLSRPPIVCAVPLNLSNTRPLLASAAVPTSAAAAATITSADWRKLLVNPRHT
jgi:hypothetical protein